MSISASLANALSGLTAASRRAEAVSSNVANASTPGYARRVVELQQNSVGGVGAGVVVTSVRREVDAFLLADRRLADASLGAADARATALARIETAIGTPDVPGSLGDRVAVLEASLIDAAAHPESEARLASVLDAAQGLAGTFTAISGTVQEVRARADADIARDVTRLNEALLQVEALNAQIVRARVGVGDANSLIDQRAQVIDDIAAIVPIRQFERDHGVVALFTPGGATLIDGPAREFAFTPALVMTPAMTLSGGALSGLSLNGTPVPTDGAGIAGGRLAANFALRDAVAPGIQAGLDGLARDMIDRFAGADGTLAPGAAGLFTDLGAAFVPANETGISARMAVNPLADPAGGGALFRLRDGLGAVAPGPGGASTLLLSLADALGAAVAPGSAALPAAPRDATGRAADLLSGVSRARVSAEAEQGFAAARHGALRSEELAGGVDTDAELSDLLRIEQAYAANARVIQTVDELIQILLRN